ncbi:MAG: hypothetical protein ABIW57_12660 [Polyangia bacterium]
MLIVCLLGCIAVGCGNERGVRSGTGGMAASGGRATGGGDGGPLDTGGGGPTAGQSGAGGQSGGGTGGSAGRGGDGGQIGGAPGAGGISGTGGVIGPGWKGDGAGGSDNGAGGVAGGGAGGITGGGATVSYSGCSYIGGLDWVVVAKWDAGRNLCAVIAFSGGENTSGVILPAHWRVVTAFIADDTAATCLRRVVPAGATLAAGTTGSASWTVGSTRPYGSANVDVLLHFSGDAGTAPDEHLRATSIDVSRPCQ